jgi:hypothetical protein
MTIYIESVAAASLHQMSVAPQITAGDFRALNAGVSKMTTMIGKTLKRLAFEGLRVIQGY